ncbi:MULTISPECIES: hypothetical protein [Inquilinus]|uniref:Uncharacterized protein n=1 Tax=Inquilinus ginsengisoli TaxID=363840 RepID=A0ABU1JK43_9PROT|nr:hypothetical protein [Inquilinus ginsengisoli]MDR6288702.1 hypothetical protein [Inquilinus ginsengisoli]
MAPQVKRAGLLTLSCFAALVAYTALIGGMDPPSALALADWLAPLTRLMKRLVPAVSMVETGLQDEGLPARATIIAHAYAMQWFLAYASLLLPLPDLWRGRGYLKALVARVGSAPGAQRPGLRVWAGIILVLALFAFLPFFGPSAADGQYEFDLALSNAHLFERLLFLSLWIITGFAACVAVICKLTRPDAMPRPESSAP